MLLKTLGDSLLSDLRTPVQPIDTNSTSSQAPVPSAETEAGSVRLSVIVRDEPGGGGKGGKGGTGGSKRTA